MKTTTKASLFQLGEINTLYLYCRPHTSVTAKTDDFLSCPLHSFWQSRKVRLTITCYVTGHNHKY